MKEEKITFKEGIKINRRGIKLIPKLIHWNLVCDFIMAVLLVAVAYWSYVFMAVLIDDITASASHSQLIKDVVMLVGGGTLLKLLSIIFQYVFFYRGSDIWERANAHLNQKIMNMDYEYMESETVQNMRRDIDTIARTNGGGINQLFWRLSATMERTLHIFVALGFIVYFVIHSASAFPGEPVKAIAYMIVFIALIVGLLSMAIIINKKAQEDIFKKNDELIPLEREYYYYSDEYIQKEENTKNIRMFHQQGLISSRTKVLYMGIFDKYKVINMLREKQAEWMGVIEALISCLVYLMMGILVLKGAFSIGSVCLYAGCVTTFLLNFHTCVKMLMELWNNTRYLKKYFDFLDIPNKKYEGTLPVEKRDDNKFTMEFKNVSFRYPGTDVDILKNFSLKFRIGERLAVVGRNGSGKTTFIKLLCRLYDPTEGEILLNGIDIRKYDYQEYLGMFSVVFQDFKIPAFSLGQNVAAAMEYDEELVIDSLNRVGLSDLLGRMTMGLDTPISTDFDKNGVDVSGGESQKIAIARALYHNTPFVILDEPTAALDPLAEYEVYSKFDELVGNKTAVYISHRLSSCQFCNDIIVIDHGKAVQRGLHQTLVQDKDGLYFKLWNTQAQYYQS